MVFSIDFKEYSKSVSIKDSRSNDRYFIKSVGNIQGSSGTIDWIFRKTGDKQITYSGSFRFSGVGQSNTFILNKKE